MVAVTELGILQGKYRVLEGYSVHIYTPRIGNNGNRIEIGVLPIFRTRKVSQLSLSQYCLFSTFLYLYQRGVFASLSPDCSLLAHHCVFQRSVGACQVSPPVALDDEAAL